MILVARGLRGALTARLMIMSGSSALNACAAAAPTAPVTVTVIEEGSACSHLFSSCDDASTVNDCAVRGSVI